ncbi:holin [Virgibacillus phasianinus]|uniref:Holin n=1 Tax=Virgibacillus phasianinus TaxID=2017483 RepID=A0A220U7Q9_9BACI|nr:LrgB family protein [Virgibacillus phasianinus]ASK63773.1 holin [Virgibacillus phasianinus]
MMLLKIVSLILTMVIYSYAKKINKRKPGLLFSPIILTPLAMILFLLIINLSYKDYASITIPFNEMLNVVTVAFAIPLYRNWSILAANWRIILYSLSVGSFIAILAGVLTTFWIGLGSNSVISIIPRSITTPIAVSLSESIGGIPTLTAVFVMLTSFSGVYLGPKIAKFFSIDHPLAIGMMYGMGAHALGTVKAFEYGDVEGAGSSLSNVVGAMITVIWAFTLTPLIVKWM